MNAHTWPHCAASQRPLAHCAGVAKSDITFIVEVPSLAVRRSAGLHCGVRVRAAGRLSKPDALPYRRSGHDSFFHPCSCGRICEYAPRHPSRFPSQTLFGIEASCNRRDHLFSVLLWRVLGHFAASMNIHCWHCVV